MKKCFASRRWRPICSVRRKLLCDFIRLFIFSISIFSVKSKADDDSSTLMLGAGADYTLGQTPNLDNTGSVIFTGPSYNFELRLRHPANFDSQDTVGVDFFALYDLKRLNSSAESFHQNAYGVGFDITFSKFFFGASYLRGQSQIASTTNSISFPLQGLDGRIGLSFKLSKSDIYLNMGVSNTLLTALVSASTGPSRRLINENSFFLKFDVPLGVLWPF